MATATLTTINPILKEVYAPRIENQIQDECVGLKRIEHTAEGLDGGGKYVTFPVRVSRNSGVGARLENEATPIAGVQGFKNVQIPLKYEYGAMKLTGQVIKLAVTNPQAFANAADQEANGLKDDLVKNTSREFYGDGTGLLASFSSADGVNNFIATNLQYLNEGDQIDIITTATGVAKATSRTITTISPVAGGITGTVTYDGADVTVATGDGIYRAGNFIGGITREPLGLAKIIAATGSLQNLDPATAGASRWASTVLSNSSVNRALSEGLMMQLVDQIRIASGQKPSVIFTSLGVRRAYFNLLSQQRRYTDVKTFDGGMQGLAFNMGTEIPVVEDVDCTYNTMYMVCEKEMALVKNTDWEWIDDQGDILCKVAGYDIFEGTMRKFWEIATKQRNAHGRISDITEG